MARFAIELYMFKFLKTMKLRKDIKYLPLLLIILISGISCNTRKKEFRDHRVFYIEYTDSSINVCSIEDGYESHKGSFKKIRNEYYGDNEKSLNLALSTKKRHNI